MAKVFVQGRGWVDEEVARRLQEQEALAQMRQADLAAQQQAQAQQQMSQVEANRLGDNYMARPAATQTLADLVKSSLPETQMLAEKNARLSDVLNPALATGEWTMGDERPKLTIRGAERPATAAPAMTYEDQLNRQWKSDQRQLYMQKMNSDLQQIINDPVTDPVKRQAAFESLQKLNQAPGTSLADQKTQAEIAKLQAETEKAKRGEDAEVTKLKALEKMFAGMQDGPVKQSLMEKYGFAAKPVVEEKPMTAAQRAKFEGDFAKDYQTVGQTQETMGQILNSIEDIRKSGKDGLEWRTGLTGYMPAVIQGKEARTAQNRIDTLKGKVTQMGKALASMAGAIGPMAVQEWKIVSDAVNTIDPTAGNFDEQLQNIQNQAEGAITRIKDKYERQYVDRFDRYPQFRLGAPSTPPAMGGYDAAKEARYQEWKRRQGAR